MTPEVLLVKNILINYWKNNKSFVKQQKSNICVIKL